jgi:hypothetical protein
MGRPIRVLSDSERAWQIDRTALFDFLEKLAYARSASDIQLLDETLDALNVYITKWKLHIQMQNREPVCYVLPGGHNPRTLPVNLSFAMKIMKHVVSKSGESVWVKCDSEHSFEEE